MAKTLPRPDLKKYHFKLGLPQELEVVPLKETLSRARDMITEPHRAGFYQIVWVQKGKATLLLDFQSIPMKSGALLFIRKDRVLMYDRSAAYDGKAILFTDAFFARDAADSRFLWESHLFSMHNESPIIALAAADREIALLMDLIECELARPVEESRQAILQNLMHTFLLQAERRLKPAKAEAAPDRAAKEGYQKFLDALENGFRKDKQVSIYAGMLGMPEKRLQAATAAACGKSPKALIDERVALEAKRLLLFGTTSVKEICFELGFDETTNFIKWFRKQAGTTPAAFRFRYQA